MKLKLEYLSVGHLKIQERSTLQSGKKESDQDYVFRSHAPSTVSTFESLLTLYVK